MWFYDVECLWINMKALKILIEVEILDQMNVYMLWCMFGKYRNEVGNFNVKCYLNIILIKGLNCVGNERIRCKWETNK
jgi:hypothetical protein